MTWRTNLECEYVNEDRRKRKGSVLKRLFRIWKCRFLCLYSSFCFQLPILYLIFCFSSVYMPDFYSKPKVWRVSTWILNISYSKIIGSVPSLWSSCMVRWSVGLLVGLSVCHNFLKGREVTLPCSIGALVKTHKCTLYYTITIIIIRTSLDKDNHITLLSFRSSANRFIRSVVLPPHTFSIITRNLF